MGDLTVATVPTACGIETPVTFSLIKGHILFVATVPTACGIETLQLRMLH